MLRSIVIAGIVGISIISAGCQNMQNKEGSVVNEQEQDIAETNTGSGENREDTRPSDGGDSEESSKGVEQSKDISKSHEGSNISSVASGGDQTDYYRQLAVTDNADDVQEAAIEHLVLPGLHENTVIYNGKVAPGQTARFVFADGETIEPVVSAVGYFSVSLQDQEISEGEEIRFYVAGNLPHEQAFDIPVHGEETDKQVIFSSADTKEQEERLLSDIDMPDLYTEQRLYEAQPARSIEAIHYSYNQEDISENIYSPYGQSEGGLASTVFEQPPSNGDTVTFFIVGDGITATVEKEVKNPQGETKEAMQSIEEATEIPDYHIHDGDYEGKTIVDATITLVDAEDSSIYLRGSTTEDGQFIIQADKLQSLQEGDALLIKIEDDEGHRIVIEREVVAE